MLFLEWRLKSKWSAMKLRVYRNSNVIWFKEKPDQEDKTLGKISLQVIVAKNDLPHPKKFMRWATLQVNPVLPPLHYFSPGQIYQIFQNNTQ